MEITAKNNEIFQFRSLAKNDQQLLGTFFEGLSQTTRSRFGPHPLTREHAVKEICPNIGADNVSRFVISVPEKIVGYFIVDFNHYPHEKSRYDSYGVDVDFSRDPVIAPCIADEYQSQGIASQAMRALIKHLSERGIRSLVLMGGTQAPNELARHFYKKFGFAEQGEFYADYNELNNIDMRLML